MKIYYYYSFIINICDLGLSFLRLCKAKKETLATLTALKWTPGKSPTAWPLQPNPATRTSSFSSIKFKQPPLGTKSCDFLPFLVNWTLTHFLMAEFGCLASTSIFSSTILLAWEVRLKGLCPNGLSCTVTMLLLGSSAATELPGKDCDTCSSYQHHGPEKKTIMFNFNISSEGIRMLGPPTILQSLRSVTYDLC